MPKSADAFRTISEVADWLETPAHVLRFWESKFTQIKPVKRAGGRRYYRPADMLLVGGIKQLLHNDGLTIKGAQKILREQGVKHVAAMSPPIDGEESGDFDDTTIDIDASAGTEIQGRIEQDTIDPEGAALDDATIEVTPQEEDTTAQVVPFHRENPEAPAEEIPAPIENHAPSTADPEPVVDDAIDLDVAETAEVEELEISNAAETIIETGEPTTTGSQQGDPNIPEPQISNVTLPDTPAPQTSPPEAEEKTAETDNHVVEDDTPTTEPAPVSFQHRTADIAPVAQGETTTIDPADTLAPTEELSKAPAPETAEIPAANTPEEEVIPTDAESPPNIVPSPDTVIADQDQDTLVPPVSNDAEPITDPIQTDEVTAPETPTVLTPPAPTPHVVSVPADLDDDSAQIPLEKGLLSLIASIDAPLSSKQAIEIPPLLDRLGHLEQKIRAHT